MWKEGKWGWTLRYHEDCADWREINSSILKIDATANIEWTLYRSGKLCKCRLHYKEAMYEISFKLYKSSIQIVEFIPSTVRVDGYLTLDNKEGKERAVEIIKLITGMKNKA